MKKLSTKIIIGLIIVILIIIIILFVMINKLSKQEGGEMNIDDETLKLQESGDIAGGYGKNENGDIDFEALLNINKCINQYVNMININNSIYKLYDDNNNTSIDENKVKKTIYDLLSKKYVEKNNISTDNVLDYVKTVKDSYLCVPLEISLIKDENIKSYAVHTMLESLSFEKQDEMFFILNVNIEEYTFSVEPLNKKYNNIDEIKITEFDDNIEYNDNNWFENVSGTYEEISIQYLNLYKRLVLGNPQFAYNLFDKQYAESRFGDVQGFVSYVEKNRKEIIGLRCEKYLHEDKEGYDEFVILDQYENYYIFDAISAMDYTVKLDTYTIATEKFKTTYDTATNEQRVQMNIDKFFQMINRHDYRTSYNCLATSFRNNYSITEESFEQIAKNKFFEHNNIEFIEYDEVSNDTLAYQVKLTDLTGQSEEEKNVTIIMQLKEGIDFEMSFDIE